MLYGSLAIRSNVLRELSGHEQKYDDVIVFLFMT
jgi:hypothetical protein